MVSTRAPATLALRPLFALLLYSHSSHYWYGQGNGCMVPTRSPPTRPPATPSPLLTFSSSPLVSYVLLWMWCGGCGLCSSKPCQLYSSHPSPAPLMCHLLPLMRHLLPLMRHVLAYDAVCTSNACLCVALAVWVAPRIPWLLRASDVGCVYGGGCVGNHLGNRRRRHLLPLRSCLRSPTPSSSLLLFLSSNPPPAPPHHSSNTPLNPHHPCSAQYLPAVMVRG